MISDHKIWFVIVMLMFAFQAQAGSPEDDLMNRFRVAHDNRDADALVDLVYPEGLDDSIRTQLRQGFQFDFGMKFKLISMKIGDWPDGMPSERNINGVIYHLNLKPVGRLEVRFVDQGETGLQNSYPIGEHKGKLYIVTGVPIQE